MFFFFYNKLPKHSFFCPWCFHISELRKLYYKIENIGLDTRITSANPRDLYRWDQHHDFLDISMGPQYWEAVLSGVGKLNH